jgi:hypothetical protein
VGQGSIWAREVQPGTHFSVLSHRFVYKTERAFEGIGRTITEQNDGNRGEGDGAVGNRRSPCLPSQGTLEPGYVPVAVELASGLGEYSHLHEAK